MELQVHNASSVKVSDVTFARDFNQTLVHQVVTAYMAGARQGSKAQKTRSDVRGGGIKPFKQKGTGRARAGTIRSPLWRTGGVTFAARPRDYSQKVNRKMYQGALRSIFSELVRQDRFVVVEDITVAEPKTKLLIDRLKEFDADDVLIITENIDETLILSARNLYKVGVIDVEHIDPVSLVGFGKVLVTVPALKKIEEWLG